MKTTAKKTVTTRNHANKETTMKQNAKKTDTTTNATNDTNEETTMKTTAKKTATTAATPATTSPSDVPTQLQALEQACGYGDPLPDDARRTNEKLVQRVPPAIVDRIIALAVRGGGVIAGITFDPNAAKTALAAADDADAVATAAQMLVRRAQDQSIRLRAGVTGDASAIRTALRGYVKTAQGASLAQENDELRSLAKQAVAARKARKTRAENVAEAATSPAPSDAEATATAPSPVPPPPTAPKAS